METKQKIDNECRIFQEQKRYQYFGIESSSKTICVICNEAI